MPLKPAHADDITIIVSDNNGRIKADAVAEKLREVLNLFGSLQESLLTAEDVVQWDIVSVTMKSPLRIGLRPLIKRHDKPQRRTEKKVVNYCYAAMSAIESGRTAKFSFSQHSLEAVKKLASTSTSDGSSISFVTSPKKPSVTITAKTVEHVNNIIAQERRYSDWTTIEGLLDIVSVRGGEKTFSITESLTGNKISCTCTEEVFSTVPELLDNRVSLTGLVKYVNHIPRSMAVKEKIRRLRTLKELTPFKDMPPIDITGNLSSEDYVRGMRQ